MSQWPSANAKTAISHQNNLFVKTGGLYVKCYIYYSLLLLERSKGRICGVTGRSYVSYIYKASYSLRSPDTEMYFDHIHVLTLLLHFSPGYSQNMISILLLPSLFCIFKNHLLNTISATFTHTSVGPPLEHSNLQGATPSRKNYFPSFCSHQLPISPQLSMGLVSPSWYTKEILLASSCQVTTTAVNSWVEWQARHSTPCLPALTFFFSLFPKVSQTWGGREGGNISLLKWCLHRYMHLEVNEPCI